MIKSDKDYMLKALRLAKKAYKKQETPIGCVIVKDGRVIGRGYNLRNTKKNVTSHAEIRAIEKACKKVGDWRLTDCVMYVTLEPCPMCAGAIVQARIPKVVIGTMSPKSGCAGSVLNLFDVEGFNHKVDLDIGVCADECAELMTGFFKNLREQKHGGKHGKAK